MGASLPAVDLGPTRTVAPSGPAVCAACPAGSYFTAVGASGASGNCTACQDFSSSWLWSDSVSDCVCNAGYYVDENEDCGATAVSGGGATKCFKVRFCRLPHDCGLEREGLI